VPRRLSRRNALRFARELLDEFGENRLLTYASAIAFRSFVALIPLTLLGIALLGASGQERVWHRTFAPPVRERVLPQVYAGIDATVEQIFTAGGALLIVFAAALTLLDVSSAVRACMSALNEITGTRDPRPPWLRYGLSLALAAGVLVCIVGAAFVVTAGAHLASGGAAGVAVGLFRWAVALVLLGLAVALVVRYAPYKPRSPAWVSAGSIAIVVSWAITSLVFRWFAGSVANYRTGPGILAAFLVLTTYVYASSIVFMLGVQLDELLRTQG
jgi:membrane protein